MKIPETHILTLSLVRQATAFFAFFCAALFLTACENEEQRTPTLNMADQTVIYEQMTGILDRLSEGADLMPALEELHTLIDSQRFLKRELSALVSESKEKPDLSNNENFSKATSAFFTALTHYQSTEGASPKVAQALSNLHDPAPIKGEGSSQ